MNRILSEKELKELYNVSDESVIPVKSSILLGHLSLLGRHEKGNEQRIEKLRSIIGNMGNMGHFSNKVELSMTELLEIFDIRKNIDYERANDILQSFKHEKEANEWMIKVSGETKTLPPQEEIETYLSEKPICLTIGGQKYYLKRGRKYIIGRGTEADIMLEDLWVSRKHCELWWTNEKLMIKDLKSTNGTYVNGKRLTEEKEIHMKDVIRVGHTEGLFKTL